MSTPAQGQSVAADSAQLVEARGMSAYRAGMRDSVEQAIRLWQEAVALYQRAGDRARGAVVLSDIGLAHGNLGRADSAVAYFHRALPILREAGDRPSEAAALNNLGLQHYNAGRSDSALAHHEQALAIRRALGDRSGEAMSLHNIGLVHASLGRPDSALAYFARALPIARATGDRRGEARNLSNIGVVHNGAGRPDSALSYFAQALPILQAIGDRPGEARTLNNIGRLQENLGQPDSALANHIRALAIRRAAGDRAGEAGSLHNIGAMYRTLGLPDSALAYFALALPIWPAVGDRMGEARTLTNIGVVFNRLSRPDSALAYFVRALPIQRAVGDRVGEAATLNNMGVAHRALGRVDSALAHHILALPITRAVADRTGEATTLRNIAAAYQRDALEMSRAVAYYDSAAAVVASVAERAGGDQNRLSFAEMHVSLFADWTLSSLALAAEIGSAASARAALAAAERGRAQALLDLMRRTASGAAGIVGSSPGTIGLGGDLAQEGARLAEGVRRTGATALVYLVAGDTLLTWLIDSTGDVSISRATVSAEQLGDEVAALRAGVGADLASGRSRLVSRRAPDLDPMKRGIGGRRSWISAATRLSAWLIPPAVRQKLPADGEVVVVPHGPLNLLPFAALPLDTSGEPLGVRYSLRYVPSVATLVALADSSGPATTPRRGPAVVVGNPIMPRIRGPNGGELAFGPLAGAEAEARWVADRVGVAPLYGAAATEAEIKRLLPSASLVHLATHGYAYSTAAKARQSFVALGPSPGEDGLLTVAEVLDAMPPLQADLVVLSACQTGLGDLTQAEGTVGLQRAFLAKGARSVLVSLWSVSDQATDQLMRRFYTHWQNGAGKAEALRRAQKELRGAPDSPFHHPRFWAAFILVGASR